LSSRQRKKKPETTSKPAKSPKKSPMLPPGRPPEAVVMARRRTEVVTRQGRGFSVEEVSKAGLTLGFASRWGLRVDPRRRSALEANVNSLKRWGSHHAPEKKLEGRVRKVEEELVKVEKEVKKEAAEVEKEAVKVKKKVKKETTRAEKAVKARAKPRTKKKPED
jgi:ribosomal protein L13E